MKIPTFNCPVCQIEMIAWLDCIKNTEQIIEYRCEKCLNVIIDIDLKEIRKQDIME